MTPCRPPEEANPPLRPVTTILSVLALLFISAFAWAAPPTLEKVRTENFPSEVQPGNTYTFHLQYKQPEGDRPQKMVMFLDTPDGPVPVEGQVAGGSCPEKDEGETIVWSVKPLSSGTYRYHFEVTSTTGGTAQYPPPPEEPEQFVCVSTVTKVIILMIGLVISLLFLPFLVYVATRSANRRGDPAAAARVALVLGIAASLGLLLCLFVVQGFQYSWLGWALGILTLLAIIVVLTSRRRVA